MTRHAVVSVAALLAAACTTVKSPLPVGQSAYAVIPATPPPTLGRPYVIGPLDTISVNVFREPELSVENVQVDATGRLPLPLLQNVDAAGKTPDQLSQHIASKLAYYVRQPNVTVRVNSITQKVVVEGYVNQPGVYDIRGNSSLVEALAMARSPTDVAALDQVYVFRTVDGVTRGARFDIRRIRAGIDPDPVILAGDRVVVGLNAVKDAWREYFSAPVFNIFRILW